MMVFVANARIYIYLLSDVHIVIELIKVRARTVEAKNRETTTV